MPSLEALAKIVTGVAFEDDVSRLKTLWQLGIRVIQPTYNRRNLLGDGCMEPANAGLSRSGLDVIAHLEHALNVAGEDHVSLGTDGTVSPQELTPGFIEEFRKTTLKR